MLRPRYQARLDKLGEEQGVVLLKSRSGRADSSREHRYLMQADADREFFYSGEGQAPPQVRVSSRSDSEFGAAKVLFAVAIRMALRARGMPGRERV
jgi:hypothetical protein